MRLISIFLLFMSLHAFGLVADSDTQVRVNGRVATFGSVLAECDGDTVRALSISRPLPVKSPYLDNARVRAEGVYNSMCFPWMCVGAAFLMFVIVFFPERRRFMLMGLTVLSVLLCCDFGLRWWLGDCFPLTPGSDMCAAVALILSGILPVVYGRLNVWGIRMALLCIAGLCAVAALWGVHPAVRPVNPALVSPWLAVHVPLMGVAYALFLFSAAGAIGGNVGPVVFRAMMWGEVLLIAGIACGSLWAGDAWGRYWAWDPKETAALITAIVYAAVILLWNVWSNPPLPRRLSVIAAFAAVVVTWAGITTGLHSY